MNFSILHILKKDIRLTWRYLAVWVGLLLFKAYCIVVGIDRLLRPWTYSNLVPRDQSLVASIVAEWPMFMMFFFYVCPILLGYIVSMILKADSPIDERSLWRTRPVAGRAMLRAKLIFLGLFGILVPCSIETVVRLHYGFDAHECVRGFVETAVMQAAWISLIAAAALLFKRTFTGLLAFAAIAIIGAWAVDYASKHFADSIHLVGPAFISTPHSGYFGMGFGFIFFTLEVAAVLAMAWLMYGGARPWRGGATLAIGLLLALGLTLAGRWLFLSGDEPMPPLDNSIHLTFHTLPPKRLPADTSETHTVADGTVVTTDTVTVTSAVIDGTDQTVYGWLEDPAFPAPKDEVLRVTQVHSSLSWPDTKDRPLKDDFTNLSWWNTRLVNVSAALAAAGYGRLAWLPEQNFSNSLPLSVLADKNVFLTRKMIERAQTEPATWTGELVCEAGHLVTVADVSPSVGASWSEGNFRYAVNLSGPFKSKDSSQNFGFFINEIGPAEYLLTPPPPNDDSLRIFLLYNPHTKECIQTTPDPTWGRYGSLFSVLNAGEQDITFNFSDKRDEKGQLLPVRMSKEDVKNWVANAHLVELRYEPERRFSCAVTIDPFLVPKDGTPASANN